MLDALDTATLGKMDMGAMGAAMGRSRSRTIQDRAEAIRQGQSATADNIDSKVRGVAEEFVSVFMNQVMKSMRATVPQNEAMHGDNGEKFFQEMLDTEQSKYLAKGSGYGLTDLIYESLMTSYRMREIPQHESAALQPEAAVSAIASEEKDEVARAIG